MRWVAEPWRAHRRVVDRHERAGLEPEQPGVRSEQVEQPALRPQRARPEPGDQDRLPQLEPVPEQDLQPPQFVWLQ